MSVYNKETQREKYLRRRDKILAQKKMYYEANKDKISAYMKSYNDANKDKKKAYQEANKDKIREKENKKYECPCGGRYTHTNKSKHTNSKIHQAYLKNSTSVAS